MRYLALATDYDGTLAWDGTVAEATWEAARRLRASGRQFVLVTGRELEDLQTVCPNLTPFDRVVAENGGVLYWPATGQWSVLGPPPPAEFVQALRDGGVPFHVGHTIVATVKPYEIRALEAIRDLGLELQVIFNKDSVMVLPTGLNKATGLAAALNDLGLSPENVVGVGDAENDHAFLELAACGVAVANAVPMLKRHADFVTTLEHGRGVSELIDELVADDLRQREPRRGRHASRPARNADADEVR